MKPMGIIRVVLVVVAVVGCCLPQAALAASAQATPTPTRPPVVVDVAMMGKGLLLGQVVNAQGVAMKKTLVSVYNQQRECARAVTDANGYFAVQGLRGGVYQIATTDGTGTFRVWSRQTAPPSSQKGALIVAGKQTVRGQYSSLQRPGHQSWLSNPWIVGGIIATAVVVPVTVHNAGRPSSP